MADIKVLDKDQLSQLWTKMNNTFVQKNGVPSSWLANEYDKTLNLFNKDDILAGYEFNGSSLYPNPDWFVSGYIGVEPGKSYYLSGKTSGTSFITYDKSLNVVRGLAIPVGTYTANSGEYYIRFNSPLVDLNTIMFNEGTEPLSYTNYGGGAIAHKGDVTPILLWENGSPTTSYVTATIYTAQNLSNFRYVIIGVRERADNPRTVQYFKAKYMNNGVLFATFADDGSSTFVLSHRAFRIKTNGLEVLQGYNNNSVDNNLAIPVEVYGSNV